LTAKFSFEQQNSDNETMDFLRGIIILLILLGTKTTFAAYSIDLNTYFASDTNKRSEAAITSNMFWAASFNFSVAKSKGFYAGWNILGVSNTANDGSTTTKFASTDMGPRFSWTNKKENFQIAFSYNMRNTTTYDDGSGSETESLKGTSMLAEIGYFANINDASFLGIRLNYYAATFTESVIGTDTYAKVTYGRTMMFPSIGYMLRW
jgi:hypothetical protein